MLDTSVTEEGLPWYTYCDLGVSRKKHVTVMKFHPGMHGGQLRIEGFGGFGNQSIGFTPKNWTDSCQKYHDIDFHLRPDGLNEVAIKGTEEGEVYSKSWKNKIID